MTAQCYTVIAAQVTELGQTAELRVGFATPSVPTKVIHQYGVAPTANIGVMLDRSNITASVCDGILFKAVGGDFYIDTTVSTGGTASVDFNDEIFCAQSTAVWFGTYNLATSVAVKATSDNAAYEYLVVGRST